MPFKFTNKGTTNEQTDLRAPGPPILVQSTALKAAVFAISDTGAVALQALHQQGGVAIDAESDGTGIGIQAKGGRLAGLFEGDVEVTGVIRADHMQLAKNMNIAGDVGVSGHVVVAGNINLTGVTSDITLQNEDCAEQFNVSGSTTNVPGTVMVLDDEGLLRPSRFAYDKRVAGVISGAGSFRSAMTLGVTASVHTRVPIALLGKVYCWADADIKPIEVGDLLTSSATEGHAMAAAEPSRAFGTIIGKALQPLASGKALIPILVALQ